MPAIHSTYRERLSDGRQVWSMHRPSDISEQIVLAERQRSYLRSGSTPSPVTVEAPVRPAYIPAGNAEFDRLYREHSKRIYRWAIRFTRESNKSDVDPRSAHDACQLAWMRILEGLPEFTPENAEHESAWINTVVYSAFCSLARNWQTRTENERNPLENMSVEDATTETTEINAPISTESYLSSSSDVPMYSDLCRDELELARKSLTDFEAAVVERVWDGESYAAIAQTSEVSAKTISRSYTLAADKIGAVIRRKHNISAPTVEALGRSHRNGIIPVGTHFGFLTVLVHLGSRNGSNVYLCRCTLDGCNREVEVSASSLNSRNRRCQFHGTPGRKKL